MARTTTYLKDAIKWGLPDPILFRISPHIIRRYAKTKTWYTCGRHYESLIDPTRLLNIDPSSVVSKMTSFSKSCFHYSDIVSEVVDGKWDRKTKKLSNYDLYNAFVNHFCHGRPWDETEFYYNRLNIIRSGQSRWDCDNKQQFEHRLHEIDKLYANIKENNYMTQEKLMQIKAPAHRKIHKYWPPELNEVTVNIDRHGEFILHEGRHRLIISKLLGINTIPVRIKTRHKTWQEFRDQYQNTVSTNVNQNHPDIPNL